MVEDIVLTNLATGKTLELSMTKTPAFILKSADWGSVESTHHSYKFVNQVGEYVSGTTLETRQVVIQGWVVAELPELMTTRKAVLNSFVNPQQMIELQYAGYKLDFLPNSSIKWSKDYENSNDVIALFEIEGYAPDPMFSKIDDDKVDAATIEGKFYFPLVMSTSPDPPGGVVMGMRSTSLIVNVVNDGAVATGMKIVFVATGTVVNPSLTHIGSQQFFKLDKTLEAGEQVVVNTNVGEKGVKGYIGDDELNYFKYRDLASSWLQLDVGDNYVRYNADEGIENLEMHIYHNDRLLEVEQCF